MSWELFKPRQIRMIKIIGKELTLVYKNDAHVELEFGDDDQLDFFVNRLLAEVVEETPEYIKWN
jgi:hypothetical protein